LAGIISGHLTGTSGKEFEAMTVNQRRSFSAKAVSASVALARLIWISSVAICLLLVALAPSVAFGSEWDGVGASWSSNISPGWNGTGVPNSIGAVADHPVAATTTTTQDTGASVTVGTLSLTNNSQNSWTITNTNGITLNQDGAGAGVATISNTNPNATSSFLFISGGTLTLADNLLISNTGGSQSANGAIQISSVINGTGNITIANSSTAISQTGSIRIQTGANTFSGSVLIQKGTTTYNVATTFGGSGNTITIGQSGQGAAALFTTNGITTANPIVIAAGSGGTLTLGSVSAGGVTFSGGITLNGDVALNSESAGGSTTNFSGKVTGVGNITTSDTGTVALTKNTNDYTGTTTVNSGSLNITQSNSLGATSAGTTVVSGSQLRVSNSITVAEPLTLNGTGNGTGNAGDGALRVNAGSGSTFSGPITLGSNGVLLFNNATAGTPTTPVISGGITGTNTDLTVSSLNSSGNWTVNTNPIATGTGSLTKTGLGTLTLASANTFSGDTILGASAGTIVLANTNALQNSSLNQTGSTLTFDSSVGSHAFTFGGLKGSSNIALQDNAGTPNAVALSVGNNNNSTTYSGALSGTGGTLTKLGSGTLALTSSTGSTYTGGTTVSAGTLLANNTSGSATGSGAVSVNGGTFGGTGAVSGSVNVGATAALAPGGASNIGQLNTGALTLNAGSTFAYEMNSNLSLSAAADLLNANGTNSLTISGATLSITDAGSTALTPGTKFTLISYNGASPGAFDTHPNLSNITVGANTYVLNYNDTAAGSNFDVGTNTSFVTITVTAVPEAGSFILGALVCLAVGVVVGGKRLFRGTPADAA
jgi:fibronectin-binding autotransporter adhesin